MLDNQLTSVIKNIKKRNFLVLILIVILNIILLPNFSSLWGNGVISKVSYYLINIIDVNTYVVQIFYLIYNCFFNFFIYLILSKSIKNFLPFLIIFVQSSYIQVVHQEYIDPLFYLLIFTYFEYDKIDMFKNKLVYIYFYLVLHFNFCKYILWVNTKFIKMKLHIPKNKKIISKQQSSKLIIEFEKNL